VQPAGLTVAVATPCDAYDQTESYLDSKLRLQTACVADKYEVRDDVQGMRFNQQC